MLSIGNIEQDGKKQNLKKYKLQKNIGVFLTATVIGLSNVGCSYNTNHYSETNQSYVELHDTLSSLIDENILDSKGTIYIYKNKEGNGYQLSYKELTDTINWEYLGTFNKYDITDELLDFNLQTTEYENFYRQEIRNYDSSTNEYSEWILTDNIKSSSDGNSQTSRWVPVTIENRKNISYDDLALYNLTIWYVPKNKAASEGFFGISNIYIGLDNQEDTITTQDGTTWSKVGNLNEYVNMVVNKSVGKK
jgi:hypothetical protein